MDPNRADTVAYYVAMIKANPDALRGSFGQYRAFDASIAQNQARALAVAT